MGGTGETVYGTPGDDVIVEFSTDGGVLAGAGNDLVCVVDGPDGVPDAEHDKLAGVDLMAGDDVLINESQYVGENFYVDPGEGADVVVGGPAEEWIGNEFDEQFHDTEADRYQLGAGDDVVHSGFDELANSDDIDLGPGDDHLAFAGALGPGGRIEGGAGSDRLNPGWTDQETWKIVGTGHMVVDNRIGTATVDGAPFLAWSGLEEFLLYSTDRTFEFIGGEQDEELSVDDTVVSVDLGGGDDSLGTGGQYGDKATFEGGSGRDEIETEAISVRLDMRSELELRTDSNPHRRTIAVHGFEDADVDAVDAWIRGTRADQRIRASAFRKLEVRGLGGDDHITLQGWIYDRLGPPKQSRARGGAGDDILRGTAFADLLVGGPGRDVVDGKAKVDICDAEVRLRCEESPR